MYQTPPRNQWGCLSGKCHRDAVNFRFKQRQEASSGGAQSAAPAPAPAPAPVPVPVPAVEVIQLLLRKPDLFEKICVVKVGKSDNNEIIIMSYTFFNMLLGGCSEFQIQTTAPGGIFRRRAIGCACACACACARSGGDPAVATKTDLFEKYVFR